MPIYEQNYRSYDGEMRRHFRWWVMVKQELRILFKTRVFVYLLILSMFHFFLRLAQVIIYDIVMQDPNNPLTQALVRTSEIEVNAQMFFDFIRIQTSLVFLVTMYAGAGMICSDVSNNLTEIYFSKPLSWRDYVAGKLSTLGLVGMCMTGVPAMILLVLHNLFTASTKVLAETWWLPLPILGFSLIIVLSCALAVLVSSALIPSARFAAIAVFMVFFCDLTLGTVLPQMVQKYGWQIIAYPFAVNRVGEWMFNVERGALTVSLWGSSLFVAALCGSLFLVLCLKIRRAEMAR